MLGGCIFLLVCLKKQHWVMYIDKEKDDDIEKCISCKINVFILLSLGYKLMDQPSMMPFFFFHAVKLRFSVTVKRALLLKFVI